MTWRSRRSLLATFVVTLLGVLPPAWAQERVYFPAVEDVRQVLLEKIAAETVGLDVSIWLLTDRAISSAIVERHRAGVPVRVIGDRVALFEADAATRQEFYWLANHGVPIRVRAFPGWYPELAHWKASLFKGQNLVAFGSADYTSADLAPASATDYRDHTVSVTDDVAIVNAFRTRFDRMWNDTTPEPRSRQAGPPYFLNWDDACARESACADYRTLYPTPAPMIVDTSRTEPDHAMPPDMLWGQGAELNDWLVREIEAEAHFVDLVISRLTVDSVTNALLAKHAAGVPVRVIVEPTEYHNKQWPEFWLTHANVDRLWAAGIPIKRRKHDGRTEMRLLVTSRHAVHGSANLAAAWQRDHIQIVPAVTKPGVYGPLRDRFAAMWADEAGFAAFYPTPPDPVVLASPAHQAVEVPVNTPLMWERAAFAVSYDVYLGTTPGSLARVANVPARMDANPPRAYSFRPTLQGSSTYYWHVEARTHASPVDSAVFSASPRQVFHTSTATSGPPPAPADPEPRNFAEGIGLTPHLTWARGPAGVTYNVAFGTSSSPPTVATGLTEPSYRPGTVAADTLYYWRVTAVWNGGQATEGDLWRFRTGHGARPAEEIVFHAADHGPGGPTGPGWVRREDPTAAGGWAFYNTEAGAPTVSAPRGGPRVELHFQAEAGVRYRLWLRMRADHDSKWNDSVFVQFSGVVDATGAPKYRLGTPNALLVNLWTCGSCQSIGWGWQNRAYWLSDTGEIWFQNSGPQRISLEQREDGVWIDQIVISPGTYVDTPPGPVSGDSTIVPIPGRPRNTVLISPEHGATGVSTSPTLTWTAENATHYRVHLGTQDPPPEATGDLTATSYTASGLAPHTTYFWRVVAYNEHGLAESPIRSFTTGEAPPPEDIVIYASDVGASARHGLWTSAADASSPDGVKLTTANTGFASTSAPQASPAHYFDVTFSAQAGTPYTIWLRLRAQDNSKFNDSVWVQFSGAHANGGPIYPIGSTSGLLVNLATDASASSLNRWGWQNGAYWRSQPVTVTFPAGGTQTLRVQVREDGVELDQIVLSPGTYLNGPPGPATNDSTIVPKP